MSLPRTTTGLPAFQPMPVGNALLGDQAAFNGQMQRDGYVLLRGVLDETAVGRVKRAYIDVLIEMGVVAPGASEPIWNGTDLKNFPAKIEALHDRHLWEQFVAEPPINAFFEDMLGNKPFWVPIVEYRITPPTRILAEDPFIARHQDGFYNGNIPFTTCWVPLMDITAQMGGLAVASGLNKSGYFHDLSQPPQYRIPAGSIPDTAWCHADYHLGDLVMFDTMVPHTGLPNYSDRFRMSMDIRLMSSHAERPVLGEIVAATARTVMVRGDQGEALVLTLDDNTYCRGQTGARIPLSDMQAWLLPGKRILAASKNGLATFIRPPR